MGRTRRPHALSSSPARDRTFRLDRWAEVRKQSLARARSDVQGQAKAARMFLHEIVREPANMQKAKACVIEPAPEFPHLQMLTRTRRHHGDPSYSYRIRRGEGGGPSRGAATAPAHMRMNVIASFSSSRFLLLLSSTSSSSSHTSTTDSVPRCWRSQTANRAVSSLAIFRQAS